MKNLKITEPNPLPRLSNAVKMKRTMLKENDCPLAPDGYYWQGFPNKDGWPVRKVLYVPPCPNWIKGMCHWFNIPQKVSEILNVK